MITDIHLQNFRSYKDDSFEFTPGVNIIVGPNAVGKTNLLEAILVTAGGSSYRAKDPELIAFNKDVARIEAHDHNSNSRIVLIEKVGDHTKKQFKISGHPYQKLNHTKKLPIVIFEPNHLRILNGSPEMRRDFLDEILNQIQPGYSSLLSQYNRSLRQRNSLLKKGLAAKNQLFVWNIRLSELGQQLVQARHQLVIDLNKKIGKLYIELSSSPKTKIQAGYKTLTEPELYGSTLLRKLEENTEEDIERGFTTYGPHRDDLLIKINTQLASESASRGEIRTIILTLKMIEAELLEKNRNSRPVLLLDDVFSELDGKRRQTLTKFLNSYQAFITTTDADIILQHFTRSSNVIPIQP